MPGTVPGILGVAAFAGINFVPYSFAASGLKKFEPTVVASATKIAAARTGLGFVLGPPATFLGALLTEAVFFRSGYSRFRECSRLWRPVSCAHSYLGARPLSFYEESAASQFQFVALFAPRCHRFQLAGLAWLRVSHRGTGTNCFLLTSKATRSQNEDS